MPLGFAKSILAQSATGSMGTPEAVVFDGTNDVTRRSGGITISDGKQGSLSIFYRRNNTNNTMLIGNQTDSRQLSGFYLQLQAAQVLLQCRDNADPSDELVAMSNSRGDTTGVWHHVLCSWNIANGNTDNRMYVNDSSANVGVNNGVDGTIDYDTANGTGDWAIGAGVDNTGTLFQKLNGEIGPVWFNDTWIDFNVEANRRKFINADGTPADMGSDGSTPTGSQPKIFMNGNATYWNAGTNGGTGGAFTMTGSVTDSGNEPIDAI